MRLHAVLLCVAQVAVHFPVAKAFVFKEVSSRKAAAIALAERIPGSFVPDLPNPFKGLNFPGDEANDDGAAYDSSPEGLVAQAKRVLSSDLGLLDPSVLDDARFQWISPSVDKPLDKTDYLAAGRFFDLRKAFPDLDYRAHDFRVDEEDPDTIRLTCRIVGTMRGELRLRDAVLPPTGNTMRCPPEAFSITFDRETGKVVKLCTGFCLDRLVGNTEGTTGVVAAAITAGQPVSDWEIYPPSTVFKRFFGRPTKPIPEATNFLAPFPETVMVQLAKGVISSNMAAEDPSLLSDDFTYCTLTTGPVRKGEFLEKYAREEFRDVDPNPRNFRVDPYDPERVWVDIKPTGPGYVGAPQAMSFTFDQDGFCTRVTSGAVMDPTIGNGDGLGGPDGVKYAKGEGANALDTRPLPRILGRSKNSLLSVFTGDTSLKPAPVSPPPSAPKAEKSLSPLEKLSLGSAGATAKTRASQPASPPKTRTVSPPKSPPSSPKMPPPKKKSGPSPLEQLSASLGGSINLLRPETAAPKPKPTPKANAKPAPKVTPPQKAKSATRVAKPVVPPKSPQKKAEPKESQPKPSSPLRAFSFSSPKPPATPKKTATIKPPAKKPAPPAQEKKPAKPAPPPKKKTKPLSKSPTLPLGSINLAQFGPSKTSQQAKKEAKLVAQRKAAEAEAMKKQQAARKVAREQELREQQAKAAARKAAQDQERKEAARRAQEKERLAAAEAKRAAKEEQRAAAAEAKKAQERERQAAAEAKRAVKESSLAAKKATFGENQRTKKDATSVKDQKKQEQATLAKLAKAASSATISLLGFGKSDTDDSDDAPRASKATSVKKAPTGVPTLKRWRKNIDGSVSGQVTGSRNFNQGEKITTSRIAKGTIANGEVVTTGSGSRYFLE